jgi:hypothetical protein
VTAVKQEHERHRPGALERRCHLGKDFNGSGIVWQQEAGQLVLQAPRFVRTAHGGIESPRGDARFHVRRDRLFLYVPLGRDAIEATATAPDRKLIERCARRDAQAKRVAPLHGIAQQSSASADLVTRTAHAQRRVARPDERVPLESPAGRQWCGRKNGAPRVRQENRECGVSGRHRHLPGFGREVFESMRSATAARKSHRQIERVRRRQPTAVAHSSG